MSKFEKLFETIEGMKDETRHSVVTRLVLRSLPAVTCHKGNAWNETEILLPCFRGALTATTAAVPQSDTYALVESIQRVVKIVETIERTRITANGFSAAPPAVVAIWEAGPKTVAEEIERIRGQFALEQEIAALKEKLSKTVEVIETPQRGHNQPPELIDDAKAIQQEITLIWDDLKNLEVEIQREDPSPDVIRKYALRLWEISQKILKYCASVGDTIVKAAAKTIGTAVGTAVVTEVVAPGTLQSVVKLALEYASKLGAG